LHINDRDTSETDKQSASTSIESPVNIKDFVQMIVSLKQQVERQREELDGLSERMKKSDDNLKLLIKELVKAEYIQIGERRNPLQRNIASIESLINIMIKKRMITRKELFAEMKKCRKTESPE
jgi:hypothetical protein